MDLTFLGTGSAITGPRRVQSGLLVETTTYPLLVDCGAGVLSRLAQTDIGPEGISGVLITHCHLDHVADILPLLKHRWLDDAGHIELIGPKGLAGTVESFLDGVEYLEGRISYSIREIAAQSFEVGPYSIEAVETAHSLPGYAYRITTGKNTITISGDTEASPTIASLADGSDVLVHDCSFPDDVDVDNHPTPSQLGRVLAGYDYGRVYLTHLYPHTNGRHDQMRASIEAHYDGWVGFARDGLTVAIDQSSG